MIIFRMMRVRPRSFHHLRAQSVKASDSANQRLGNLAQFRHERTGAFVQVAPDLKNPYLGDELLQDIILRHCPPEHYKSQDLELRISINFFSVNLNSQYIENMIFLKYLFPSI